MRNRTEGGTHPVKLPAARDDAGLSDPLIGQLIQDRYRLSSRLAAGSTGVYWAHDVRDLTEVTVKLLPARFDADDRLIASIRAKLSVTRTLALTKPALAAAYDLQRLEGGGALVVMEPLDGTSLADVIREEAPLLVDRALHLALQIAEALETAHNAGFVHGALEAEHVWKAPFHHQPSGPPNPWWSPGWRRRHRPSRRRLRGRHGPSRPSRSAAHGFRSPRRFSPRRARRAWSLSRPRVQRRARRPAKSPRSPILPRLSIGS